MGCVGPFAGARARRGFLLLLHELEKKGGGDQCLRKAVETICEGRLLGRPAVLYVGGRLLDGCTAWACGYDIFYVVRSGVVGIVTASRAPDPLRPSIGL